MRAAAGRQAARRVSNSFPATANASADLRATGVSAAYLPAHCPGVGFISGSSELRFLVSINLGSVGWDGGEFLFGTYLALFNTSLKEVGGA